MTGPVEQILAHVRWTQSEGIWPGGHRHLLADAYGLVLYVSLYRHLEQPVYLARAHHLAAEVERTLRRRPGYAMNDDGTGGQYFHYVITWAYALGQLARIDPGYRDRARQLARELHERFFVPGRGVYFKMNDDLSAPSPGLGLGGADPFLAHAAYRAIDADYLRPQLAELAPVLAEGVEPSVVTYDFALGQLLWACSECPDETWTEPVLAHCLDAIDRLWVTGHGYVSRSPGHPELRFAVPNYLIAFALHRLDIWPERTRRICAYFAPYLQYDRSAIANVLSCLACWRHPPELVREAPLA